MICRNCNQESENKYCSNCGSAMAVRRLTISSVTHEVLHTFSHFDKGFLYTLAELLKHPGLMQKKYVEGYRSGYQKPFSMFFVCATIYGIAMYFIINPSAQYNLQNNGEIKMHFYRHYFVFLQAILLPLYVLIYWILFRSKDFNYAEAFVSFLYSLSFLLLLLIPLNMVNLLPFEISEKYIEIPAVAVYLIWTNLNYFKLRNTFFTIFKTIVLLLLVEFISNSCIDYIVGHKLLV